MNTLDSEHMLNELEKYKNYTQTKSLEDADLILVNTCSVREKPVQKLFSELGQFNAKKKKGAKIGVCGCTASHLGNSIIERAPYVDFVLGARNISKIKDVVDIKGSVEIDINYNDSTYEFAPNEKSIYKTQANISIGCDKKCSYCIVPSTRGEEISIPQELLISQIRKDVENGAIELMLLGQNVNAYGKRFSDKREKTSFTKLLQEISKIDGLKRIRFTSPHPLHMDDEFIEEFASNPKICKNIHMPLQSGSNEILKAMRRGYTKEWFLSRVEKLKKLVPELRISTDIIVAFPKESEADFLDTLAVVEEVKFDQIFNFIYSPRPNTKALELKEFEIPRETAVERLTRLIELHKLHQSELMQKNIGKEFDVLAENLSKNGEVFGYSDNNLQVFFKASEEALGKIQRVRVNSVSRTSMQGQKV